MAIARVIKYVIVVSDEDQDLLDTYNFRQPQLLARRIAKRYLGEKPDGYHLDHIDNDWKNNKRDNLQYITAEQNLLKNSANSKDRRTKSNGKQVIFEGVKYPSIAAFCREHGLSLQAVASRIRRGYPPKGPIVRKNSRSSPVTVFGILYPNYSQAAKATGINYNRIRDNVIDGVFVPEQNKSVIIGGIKYASRKEASIALGVTRQRIAQILQDSDYAANYKVIPPSKRFHRNGKRRNVLVYKRCPNEF